MNKKFIRITAVILAFVIAFCGAPAFAGDSATSGWDSAAAYPADVLGTELLVPVKYLIDKKIITGDTDGLFHPEKNISRAEFATMAAKATNNIAELENLANEDIFADLSGYGWAKPYINAVVRAGLFKGRGSDKFAPGDNVTNAEVITVLIRMNKGAAESAESMAPKWPENYILYAEKYNLLGTVVIADWNAPATKRNVALLLYRVLPKN